MAKQQDKKRRAKAARGGKHTKSTGRPTRLSDACVEFVPQAFDFADTTRWTPASDVQCFSCPTCGGEGNVKCGECRGKGSSGGDWCMACEGQGAIGCEDCDGGVVPNWPTRNVIYPLPEDFDRPEELAQRDFGYVIAVKAGPRYFLAFALPEFHMRTVTELPTAMMEAYTALGYLPPASLVVRLIDGSRLDCCPDRRLLGRCRRSLSLCSQRWAGRVRKFDRRFPV